MSNVIRQTIRQTAFAAALLNASAALAQSDIDPTQPHAWAENIGWTDWFAAGSPAGVQGAAFESDFLFGFIWAENIGWINLGDGTPADGVAYANTTGADFGVNRDTATGELFGLAWSENVGWINFDGGALATPPNPARLVSESGVCRLRGFAWGENIGWINLDDATRFVAAPGGCDSGCDLAGDIDADGDVDISDLALLLGTFGEINGEFAGDLDHDLDVDILDLATLLSDFGRTCG